MPVTILCPKLTCRAVLRVPDNVRGKRVRCSGCGTTFFVPKVGREEPPVKTEPPVETART
jgi:predicted Zn finger-like uncharacterized protein